MLGNKTSINKFNTEITLSIFFKENSLRLDTTNKKKNHKHMETNKKILNSHLVTEEVKKEIFKKHLEMWNDNTKTENLYNIEKSELRKNWILIPVYHRN